MNLFFNHTDHTASASPILVCFAFALITSCAGDLDNGGATTNSEDPPIQPDHCLCIQNLSDLTEPIIQSAPIWINNCIGLDFPDESAMKALYVDSITVAEEDKLKLSHVLQRMDSCLDKNDWVYGCIDDFDDHEELYSFLVFEEYGEDIIGPIEKIDPEIVLTGFPGYGIQRLSGCSEFYDSMEKFGEDYISAAARFINDPYGFDNYKTMVKESRKFGYYLSVWEITDCSRNETNPFGKYADSVIIYRKKMWNLVE